MSMMEGLRYGYRRVVVSKLPSTHRCYRSSLQMSKLLRLSLRQVSRALTKKTKLNKAKSGKWCIRKRMYDREKT